MTQCQDHRAIPAGAAAHRTTCDHGELPNSSQGGPVSQLLPIRCAYTGFLFRCSPTPYIARLYAVKKRACLCQIRGEELRLLREQVSQPLLADLHAYLEQIQEQLLPKSDAGQAVAYTPRTGRRSRASLQRATCPSTTITPSAHCVESRWDEITGCFWAATAAGRTMAVLPSFTASCELVKVDPLDEESPQPISLRETRLQAPSPRLWAAAWTLPRAVTRTLNTPLPDSTSKQDISTLP